MANWTVLQVDKAASAHKDILWKYQECRVRTDMDSICDCLLLIIAKKHYMLNPSLHSILNSISQLLFKRGGIKDIFNQTNLTANVPEGDGLR